MLSFAQPVIYHPTNPTPTGQHQLLRFEADSARGFNFPYLVFLPAGVPLLDSLFLLVEPNNTGFWNDTLAVHERAARYTAQVSSVGHAVAKSLRIPLLVPVFPRPTRDSLTYTHAFDRDAALLCRGAMQRLDKQLLAMVDDARSRLATQNIILRKQVLLNGFSASGTFVNRLALIHPERVAATACGGINALPMLPVTTLRNTTLNYPLGLADFTLLFGKAPNLTRYRQIPQLLYMGEYDDNDAVLFDDAYGNEECNTVFAVIGKTMLPDRWATGSAVYRFVTQKALFSLYPGIGHGTTDAMNQEIAQFFNDVIQATN